MFKIHNGLTNKSSCIVDKNGFINFAALLRAITDKTILISIMAANNEIGTIQNIKAISHVAHDKNIVFHTDCVQLFGHMNLDVKDLGIDAMTISAHKIYGPKGVGALYLSNNVAIDPIIFGGNQERSRRGGTCNTAGIVGFAVMMHFKETFAPLRRSVHDRKGMTAAVATTIFGPFVGVGCSLMAVQYTAAGIASTLMALTPIIIILPARWLFGQPITLKSVVGAIISVVGVSLFFLFWQGEGAVVGTIFASVNADGDYTQY